MAKNKSVVIECWDNGGKTADRFTIAISGIQEYGDREYTIILAASANPFHPQGVGQHCAEVLTRQHRQGSYRHLGERMKYYDLPDDVKRFVANELTPEN